jgi:hypothetical protein
MKVKFVSGPKTGTIEHLQPSIANTLIAAGLAEHIPYKSYVERLNEESAQANKPVAVVRWQCIKDDIKGRFAIVAKCNQPHCNPATFHGDPKVADTLVFQHSCGCGSTETVTNEVVEQYRKQFRPVLNLSSDQAYAAICAGPSHDKPYFTADEILESNRLRGATSESSPAKCAGFAVDVPYKTAGEIMKENLARGAK